MRSGKGYSMHTSTGKSRKEQEKQVTITSKSQSDEIYEKSNRQGKRKTGKVGASPIKSEGEAQEGKVSSNLQSRYPKHPGGCFRRYHFH